MSHSIATADQEHGKYLRAHNAREASRLQYEAIPALEARLGKLTKQRDATAHYLTQRIGPEQIAEIVARWTGIPVSKLSQSDAQKVLDLCLLSLLSFSWRH